MTINKQAKHEAKQFFNLCVVGGSLDETRVRQVSKSILAANYRNCPAVVAHFLRLVKLDHSRHTATIESATPLSPELQTATQADLTRLYGPGLNSAFIQRPSLIGGMRIRVGCDVYDGSVQARLAALEKSF